VRIAEHLDIAAGSVVAFVGGGGKSSLIVLLAEDLRQYRLLISPTTKMFPIKTERNAVCLGRLNMASGKLEALPDDVLQELIPRYEVTLLEADGSAGLPCKGWLESEPVVPPYCTHTVGLMDINVLGKPAISANVHRLPEFLTLTGLEERETVTARALEAMACHPKGMFRRSAGKRYLIVNQAEDETAARAALSLLGTIKKIYPKRFHRLIYGSAHQNTWKEV